MNIGKIKDKFLDKKIVNYFTVKKEEVLLGPKIGGDFSAIKVGEGEVVVLTTSPVISEPEEVGRFALELATKNVELSGATCFGIMLSIIVPLDFTNDRLFELIKSIEVSSRRFGVMILGGDTLASEAVTKPIITATGIGFTKKEKVITINDVKEGDDIVMTGFAGDYGTLVIASRKEEELTAVFGADFLRQTKKQIGTNFRKVIDIAKKSDACAIHDITECGVNRAIWDFAIGANIGITIDIDAIPITRYTIEICEYYDINPYELFCHNAMLIATEDGESLVSELLKEGVRASLIGKATSDKKVIIKGNEINRTLIPPKIDELYRVIK